MTPGFIDVHTYYYGQATWDDQLEPSASNGVTTVVMGNCGVGFAPVRPAATAALIDLMEGVEDIPGSALSAGMPWGHSRPGCPLLLDATGTDIAISHGRAPLTGANTYPQLVDLWHRALSRAQYVWLSKESSRRIPWTPALAAYFHDNFTRILGTPSSGALYRHDNTVNLLGGIPQLPKISRRTQQKSPLEHLKHWHKTSEVQPKRETMSWQRSGQPASGS